jgi:hypothetical protein
MKTPGVEKWVPRSGIGLHRVLCTIQRPGLASQGAGVVFGRRWAADPPGRSVSEPRRHCASCHSCTTSCMPTGATKSANMSCGVCGIERTACSSEQQQCELDAGQDFLARRQDAVIDHRIPERSLAVRRRIRCWTREYPRRSRKGFLSVSTSPGYSVHPSRYCRLRAAFASLWFVILQASGSNSKDSPNKVATLASSRNSINGPA